MKSEPDFEQQPSMNVAGQSPDLVPETTVEQHKPERDRAAGPRNPGPEKNVVPRPVGATSGQRPKAANKRWTVVREIAETVFLALLMFLVIRFAIQNFNIDGTSMEPNLHNTELVLVDKWTYLFHPPERGDVIVFRAPPEPTQDYVKRVIGLPGDTITIRGTTVIVDGTKLNETYVAARNQGVPPGVRTITNMVVPSYEYFVLGDNRIISSDSRIWGFVPRQNIIGKVALVYWPLGQNNDGFLPAQSSIFANVHASSNQESSPIGMVTGNINALWLLLIPVVILAFLRRKSLKRWFRFSPSSR